MFLRKPLICSYILTILFISFEISGQKVINQEVNDLSSVALLELPALDNVSLKKSAQKNSPNTFAEARGVHISPLNHGTWESTKSGISVWRQRIKSPMAFSLNLGFTDFKLEKSVSLFIYNKEKTEVIGPFTEKDNDDHLQLWTPMISGDEIVVEVQGTYEAINKSRMVISSVNHDFVDYKLKLLSGSCNIDVACGEEDGWGIIDNYRDIISSVGAYTLNGINQCSGMLVNNTAMDCRPYFITADHCDISPSNASSVVVYWNYENSTCRQPNSGASGSSGDGPRSQFNSGATLRASSRESDFALIELDDPVDPTLNLFFSGWDLSGELTDTSICIHHPRVEEKRISFDFDPMIYESGNVSTNYVRVLDWDLGTTEPGSSGAPIFNSRKQFIGQLNGGFAACGNNEHDVFGYINYSWDREGSNSRSLKPWLDPLGSGQISLDGTYCGLNLELSESAIDVCTSTTNEVTIDILPSSFFTTEILFSAMEIPEGLMVEFLNQSSLGSEPNSFTVSGFENLATDEFDILIIGDDGSNLTDAVLSFSLYSDIPDTPSPNEPANNTEDISSKTILKIFRSPSPNNVFQLAVDADFDKVVVEETTSFLNLELENLLSNTTYFWRVKSFNICGETEWSEIFTFSTAPSFCTTISSNDGPQIIDENIENTVSSAIPFNYPVRVQDVNVQNVKGTHTYVEDLAFRLIFNNNEVLLVEERCGNMDDFNFGFDDESQNTQIDCPPTSGDLYLPKESLELFDDELAGGTWILSAEDMVTNDGGTLEGWTIRVCFNETEATVIVPEFHEYNYCENQLLSVDAYYNTQGLNEFDIVAFDEAGQNILTQYFEIPNKENQLRFDLDTEMLSNATHTIQLVLRNKNSLEVLAVSSLILNESGSEKSLNITQPINGDLIPFDGFNEINWESEGGILLVEISTDVQFSDIVYSQSVVSGNSLDVSSLSLLPGVYFVKISSQYDCGEVSSKAINFTIDESNAVIESDKLQIELYPNPTNGLVYIKNEIEFENKTSIQLFDISGRYIERELKFISSNLVILDMSGVEDGLYIVKIQKDDRTLEKLIVKSH